MQICSTSRTFAAFVAALLASSSQELAVWMALPECIRFCDTGLKACEIW